MKNETRYQAASLVSATVENHFAEYINLANDQGESNLAPVPRAEIIEKIIDAAFWASLRREEGRSPKISLAYFPPEPSSKSLQFKNRFPLDPDTLTKLSPGVEKPGIYLGIWYDENGLYIWGTTFSIPNLCFVLDVSEPALLVIKHRKGSGFGKFTNVAVLKGDQVKIIDAHNAKSPYCPDLLISLLGFTVHGSWSESMNILIQFAVSMRAHQRGGTLLIVPDQTERWHESIVQPIKYAIDPSYTGLYDLMQLYEKEKNLSIWQGALRNELESLAGLTAVDGATIMSKSYKLLAFGAKIGRPEGSLQVEEIFFHEPVLGGEAVIINAAQSGGTRHLSAAQFVHDQRDAMALVASQDGHFTVYTWLPSEDMVQAYRIDTLLL